LPILSAQTFRDNLANYNKPLVSWRTYFAKRGERMENIASKFGIQLSKLRNVNNLPTQNKIKKSSTILVPNGNNTELNLSKLTTIDDTKITQTTETNPQISTKQDSSNLSLATIDNITSEEITENNQDKIEPIAQRSITHKVKKGETLQSLARRYDISVQQIMKSNSLKSKRIKTGQVLAINTTSKPQRNTRTKTSQTQFKSKTKVSKTK
jgi:membrane-bound lytic murein transglycosylase D